MTRCLWLRNLFVHACERGSIIWEARGPLTSFPITVAASSSSFDIYPPCCKYRRLMFICVFWTICWSFQLYSIPKTSLTHSSWHHMSNFTMINPSKQPSSICPAYVQLSSMCSDLTHTFTATVVKPLEMGLSILTWLLACLPLPTCRAPGPCITTLPRSLAGPGWVFLLSSYPRFNLNLIFSVAVLTSLPPNALLTEGRQTGWQTVWRLPSPLPLPPTIHPRYHHSELKTSQIQLTTHLLLLSTTQTMPRFNPYPPWPRLREIFSRPLLCPTCLPRLWPLIISQMAEGVCPPFILPRIMLHWTFWAPYSPGMHSELYHLPRVFLSRPPISELRLKASFLSFQTSRKHFTWMVNVPAMLTSGKGTNLGSKQLAISHALA